MIKLQHNEEKCPTKFITKACKVYNAKFLGRFLFKPDLEKSVYFFYCSNPPNETYSKYFTLYPQDAGWWIAGGDHFNGRQITALKVEDKYYYSSDQHDFVSVGEDFIDGGEVYVRTNAAHKLVTLVMKDGEWYE